MEVSLEQIVGWVGEYSWPFLRFAAMFLAAPIFGARTVPVRIRIVLAAFITFLIQPVLPAIPVIDPLSSQGFLIIIQQLAIGIVLGLTMQIVFSSLVMAGHVIATSMGLGFASTVDPQNGVQVTVLGQVYLILATLFFLAVDGHLVLIKILADSFIAMPVTENLFSTQVLWGVVEFSSQMFLSAILIALPILVGVLLVNLAFGVITRAAPQLNIFAVGFPSTMLAGFVLIFMSLPVLSPLLENLFMMSFDFLSAALN